MSCVPFARTVVKSQSPAWSALEMAAAIILDKRKILPFCVKLEGEYGVDAPRAAAPRRQS
jgi:malate/lactate dehydrogenase